MYSRWYCARFSITSNIVIDSRIRGFGITVYEGRLIVRFGLSVTTSVSESSCSSVACSLNSKLDDAFIEVTLRR